MKNVLLFMFGLTMILSSCADDKRDADAYGNFEADEIILSSEVPGKIISIYGDEGMTVDSNQVIAQIDTIQLNLKKLQLEAAIKAVLTKTKDIAPQINV